MTIFTRYVTALFIRLLLLCYGAFVSIYLVIDILEKVGKLTRYGGTAHQILTLFLWKLPEITVQILPLALLMATLLTLGSLSRTSELTAMRCSGAGLIRISAPIIAVSIAASLLNLALYELVIPVSTERMSYIEEVLIKKRSRKTYFRRGEIWFRDNRTILNAKLLDPANQTLHGVTLWEIGENLRPASRIEASEGKRTEGGWLLRQAVQYRYSSGAIIRTTEKPEWLASIRISTDDLKTVGKNAENMGFAELLTYCNKLKTGGYDPTRYLTLLHAKLAAPMSPLVMAFLAIPFSLKGGRSSGPALGIGISILIGICYFVVNAFLVSFGQAGALPPVVAAWAANILFIASGIWLALTVNR